MQPREPKRCAASAASHIGGAVPQARARGASHPSRVTWTPARTRASPPVAPAVRPGNCSAGHSRRPGYHRRAVHRSSRSSNPSLRWNPSEQNTGLRVRHSNPRLARGRRRGRSTSQVARSRCRGSARGDWRQSRHEPRPLLPGARPTRSGPRGASWAFHRSRCKVIKVVPSARHNWASNRVRGASGVAVEGWRRVRRQFTDRDEAAPKRRARRRPNTEPSC